MTREMGSLGKDVAAGSPTRSNKKVVYHEIIEPIANKMRLRKSHVERFLEGKSGIWERLTTDKTSLSIFTATRPSGSCATDSTAVIRAGARRTCSKNVPHVMRVRVCAPLETRVQPHDGAPGHRQPRTVESEIQLSEEAHTAITKRHFGVNWRDAENYDLVLYTERLSVEECVEEIEGDEARRVPGDAESRRMVENLSLEVERALGAAARRPHHRHRITVAGRGRARLRAWSTRRGGARRGRGGAAASRSDVGRQPAAVGVRAESRYDARVDGSAGVVSASMMRSSRRSSSRSR
jgi:hypothetical protein